MKENEYTGAMQTNIRKGKRQIAKNKSRKSEVRSPKSKKKEGETGGKGEWVTK
jgi:hypothetical protein